MKTPRVHDFDPNLRVPELGSPLDNLPAIQKPQATSGKPPLPGTSGASSSSAEPEQPIQPVRPSVRTPVRRFITRYAFEFYQDQLDWLRTTSLEEKARGEQGSMSKMVREALDRYIAKKKQTEG
jgi:hypothetical protein